MNTYKEGEGWFYYVNQPFLALLDDGVRSGQKGTGSEDFSRTGTCRLMNARHEKQKA
jgi:hypothetical protein